MHLHTLIQIIDDTIQATGTPYDNLPPIEKHVRDAMFLITVLAPIAGAFLASKFAPRGFARSPHLCPDAAKEIKARHKLSEDERRKELDRFDLHCSRSFRYNKLVALWFLSIGVFGALVYFQGGRTTRGTFVLAVAHNQIEVLLNCLLLNLSYSSSVSAAIVFGFVAGGGGRAQRAARALTRLDSARSLARPDFARANGQVARGPLNDCPLARARPAVSWPSPASLAVRRSQLLLLNRRLTAAREPLIVQDDELDRIAIAPARRVRRRQVKQMAGTRRRSPLGLALGHVRRLPAAHLRDGLAIPAKSNPRPPAKRWTGSMHASSPQTSSRSQPRRLEPGQKR